MQDFLRPVDVVDRRRPILGEGLGAAHGGGVRWEARVGVCGEAEPPEGGAELGLLLGCDGQGGHADDVAVLMSCAGRVAHLMPILHDDAQRRRTGTPSAGPRACPQRHEHVDLSTVRLDFGVRLAELLFMRLKLLS